LLTKILIIILKNIFIICEYLNEYLEKVKIMYRLNTRVFISPFQGAYPKLGLGNERQGRELSFYKRD